MDLRRQPWWSEADEAEFNVLIHAFVDAGLAHHKNCCGTTGPWCPPLREAFDAVVDWRTSRVLRSKAAWLRAREEAA